MSNAKKVLNIFTSGILILLIACTFLSASVASSIQPIVEVINPFTMELIVSDDSGEIISENTYNTVIPYNAVIPGDLKNYVYIVKQRQGLFGSEYYAKLMEVEIVESNDMYAALGGWNVTAFDDVVLLPPNELVDGEVVKVINR